MRSDSFFTHSLSSALRLNLNPNPNTFKFTLHTVSTRQGDSRLVRVPFSGIPPARRRRGSNQQRSGYRPNRSSCGTTCSSYTDIFITLLERYKLTCCLRKLKNFSTLLLMSASTCFSRGELKMYC